MSLRINGSFADEISRAIHHNTSKPSHTIEFYEVEVNNDSSKEKITELFSTCAGFEIVSNADEDNWSDNDGAYILFTMKKTQEEIDDLHIQFELDRKNHLKYCINRLIKWSDSKEEWREQIKTYLDAMKLDWIVEAMEQGTDYGKES
jgi:hypothetical protein